MVHGAKYFFKIDARNWIIQNYSHLILPLVVIDLLAYLTDIHGANEIFQIEISHVIEFIEEVKNVIIAWSSDLVEHY